MTLLTHFRNKQYAVVACDQKYTYNDRPPVFKNKIPFKIELRNRTIINYSDLTSQYESNDNYYEKIRNTINQFCEASIYFNELYSCDENRLEININIHEKLTNTFRYSFINHISPDFNIELLNEFNIKDVIKSFNKEVYSWGFERKGIGGNVDLMILDIETGQIKSDVIHQSELEETKFIEDNSLCLDEIKDFIV